MEFHCTLQSYDDHVRWCEEKAKRLQDAPTKDYDKIAKLNLRVSYRPKTPVILMPDDQQKPTSTIKGQQQAKPSSSNSFSRLKRTYSLRKPEGGSKGRDQGGVTRPSDESPLRRSRSFGRAAGLSYIGRTSAVPNNAAVAAVGRSSCSRELTPDVQFVRNVTGRGSIRKGPAPTRASILRRQVLKLCLQFLVPVSAIKHCLWD